VIHITGPAVRATRVMWAALNRGVYADARVEEGQSTVTLGCLAVIAASVLEDASHHPDGPDPDLWASCQVVGGGGWPDG
jgi:hypothetical protein